METTTEQTREKNRTSVLPKFPLERVDREYEIETRDGLHLHGWSVGARTEPRANIAIVHGFKDYSDRYLDFAHRLADKGYQVFAYDHRGHARSEGDRAYFSSFEEVVDDLQSALTVFEAADHNRKPWILLGHSFGGAVVSRYIVDHPAEVEGFILSAPLLKRTHDVNGLVFGGLKLVNVLAPHLPTIDLPNEKFSRDSSIVESMGHDPLINNGKVPARSAVVSLENMKYIEKMRTNIHVPFLVLHGTADGVNNIEGSQEFFDGTSNIVGKKLKIYPNLFHDLLHEPEHQLVEDDIIQWIESLLATKH